MSVKGWSLKVVPTVATAAVLAVGGYWYSQINAEAAQGEFTRTRVTVLEHKATEAERRAAEVREELRRIHEKLDRIWTRVK